ncbi:hypothetical protein P3G55_20390 [Leptospira sp. 96542]|nr:hypothetical protein [Leptospira sp. 96542]
MNTMSKLSKPLYCVFGMFVLWGTFCGSRCGEPGPPPPEVLLLSALIQEKTDAQYRNSYEPNGTKEAAFCIDFPNQNYLIPNQSQATRIESGIFPCDDVDYYKVEFNNQTFALNYRVESAERFHFILENETQVIFDSRRPEDPNPFINSNEINFIKFGQISVPYRKIILTNLNSVYIRIQQNEGYQCQNNPANLYFINLENKSPSATDLPIARADLHFIGEFLPCPNP